jgi:hypothetical protein
MKATLFFSTLAFISLCSLSTFGQATCPNGGGAPNNNSSPYINDPVGSGGAPANDYLNSGGTAGVVPPLGQLTNSNTNLATPASTAAPSVPAARITVLPAVASPVARVTPKSPTAKLTIVADDPVASSTPKEEASAPEPQIDSRIAKLVGIWKAVARRGNGELTTVELHLDNRGWAELTVPGNDGKPSTTKSRVDFENDELKLKDDDKVVSLGKLVESNSRQMVLERAEGRVTFVRL